MDESKFKNLKEYKNYASFGDTKRIAFYLKEIEDPEDRKYLISLIQHESIRKRFEEKSPEKVLMDLEYEKHCFIQKQNEEFGWW